MGGFQVPMAQPQVPAQAGPQGGVVGPNPSTQFANPANNLAMGINQLVQGIVTGNQASKAHFKQKYDSALSDIANGLGSGYDMQEVLKWGKKAGLPLKADMTEHDLAANEQAAKITQFKATMANAQNQQQQDMSQISGMPPMPPGQPGSGAPGVVPPSPQQAAPPGFLDKMRMAMGMAPRNMNPGDVPHVSMQSPAGQMLTNLNNAAQSQGGAAGDIYRGNELKVVQANMAKTAAQLGMTKDQAQMPLFGEIAKAIQGDMNSMTILRRFNMMKEVPVDEMADIYMRLNPSAGPFQANQNAAKLLLWQQGGGPQLQLKIGDLAKDMIPRFGGDAQAAMTYVQGLYSGQPTGLKPTMTPEEFAKYAEGNSKMLERYPAAPPSLVQAYSLAKMDGNNKMSDTILDFLSSHYKSGGQISQSQFQQTLTKDYSQIASTHDVEQQRADSERLRVFNDAARTALEPLMSEMNAMQAKPDNYTMAQKEALKNRVTDVINGVSGREVKLPDGSTTTVGPLQQLIDRTGVQDPEWKQWIPFTGVPFMRDSRIQPTFKSAPGGNDIEKRLSDRDYQLLGLPGANLPPRNINTGIQQMLMQRAGGQQ